MKIKNAFFFWVSVLLILPLLYFLFDRIQFVLTAQHTSGVVERVTSDNDRCGGRRSRYNCTKYQATLRYDVQGALYRIVVSAGNKRGHNQPLTRADYQVGDRERVTYDPRRPSRAYRNKLWDVWGAPLGTLFVQIATFVASFRDRQQQKRKLTLGK